jgi:hypothetical protein
VILAGLRYPEREKGPEPSTSTLAILPLRRDH